MRIRLVLLCSLLFLFSTCTKDQILIEKTDSRNFDYDPDGFVLSELEIYASSQGIILDEENIKKINRYGTPEFISSEKPSAQKSGNRKTIKLFYKDEDGNVKHKVLTLLTVDESTKNGEVEITKNFYFEDSAKNNSKNCNEPIVTLTGKTDATSSEKREGCGTTWFGDLLRNIVDAFSGVYDALVGFSAGGGGAANSNDIFVISGSSAGQTWENYSTPGTSGHGLTYSGGGSSAGNSHLADYDAIPIYNFSLESAIRLSPYTDSPEELECLYNLNVSLDISFYLIKNEYSKESEITARKYIDFVCANNYVPFLLSEVHEANLVSDLPGILVSPTCPESFVFKQIGEGRTAAVSEIYHPYLKGTKFITVRIEKACVQITGKDKNGNALTNDRSAALAPFAFDNARLKLFDDINIFIFDELEARSEFKRYFKDALDELTEGGIDHSNSSLSFGHETCPGITPKPLLVKPFGFSFCYHAWLD